MDAVADTIVVNAAVMTMDPDRPSAEAVAIGNGRVLCVGSAAEVREFSGDSTQVVDAGGRFTMPGFHDSHSHLMTTGLGLLRPGLAKATSVADVLAVVAEAVRAAKPGAWIETAPGWHENQLAEQRFPTAAELDAVAPRNPVVIRRGGHNMAVNSAALAAAGIGAGAANPAGGTFVRDDQGVLTGHLAGKAAIAPVLAVVPVVTTEVWAQAAQAALSVYAAAGITSVIDPGLSLEQMNVYRDLAERGLLTVRTSMMHGPTVIGRDPADIRQELAALDLGARADTEWCRTHGIKLIADGGVETGYYRVDYAHPDDPDHPRGKPLLGTDILESACRVAVDKGWHLGVHVLGDAATDMVLDAFAEAAAVGPLPRWTLIHLLNPRPEHWPRIRELDLAVTAQPGLFWQLAGGFIHYLGEDRAADIGPLAEFVTQIPGRVGGGSDSPVAPYAPLAGIASAATRSTRDSGHVGTRWTVDVDTMLELYTIGSAWCAGLEDVAGRLRPGFYGDLVVLSADPRTITPEAITEIEVMATVVGGTVVHDRLS